MGDLCEWDPERRRHAIDGLGCGKEATQLAGSDGRWRLCGSCAALPVFKRLRKRVPIRRRGSEVEP